MSSIQNTKITWVNHASFVISNENINLISDPWIEGRVFNQSWDLLVPTVFTYSDFKEITHIWFSHEHPDHFFPPNVQKIPIEYRRKITVLFQETMDKKVIDFCLKMEFKEIIELKGFTTYNLSNTFKIINGKVKNETDSWLFIKTNDVSLLNLNDCLFSHEEITKISSSLPSIDILFTQFSYANWIGNSNDDVSKNKSAERKFNELKRQIEAFKPKVTIPFASYVWFCSKTNFHMNKNANSIEKTVDFIKSNNSVPVVLFPGDEWIVSTEHDSTLAVAKYMEQANNISNRTLTEFEPITEAELMLSANKYREKALSKNNKTKLLTYSPMHIYLTDWSKSVEFSFKNGLVINNLLSVEKCDVAIESQNVKYCFDHEWGYDTIQVAGTYEKPLGGNYRNLEEYQWISSLNNQGKKMESLFKRVLNRIIK
jgi:hypothetical protein